MTDDVGDGQTSTPLVDTDVLVRLQEQTGDDDGELLQELVEVFLEDARETCDRLRTMVENGPSEALSREAHRLKSGAANLGAVTMAALCKALEHTGATGPQAELERLVAELSAQIPGVQRKLCDYLDGAVSTLAC